MIGVGQRERERAKECEFTLHSITMPKANKTDGVGVNVLESVQLYHWTLS